GALPGPIQRATADATSHLGIDLPGSPSPTPPAPVRGGPRSHDDHGNGAGTTPGTHPRAATDPDGRTSTTTPGGTTATTVAPGVPTAASTPPVTVPPVEPTTPTLPLPTLG